MITVSWIDFQDIIQLFIITYYIDILCTELISSHSRRVIASVMCYMDLQVILYSSIGIYNNNSMERHLGDKTIRW